MGPMVESLFSRRERRARRDLRSWSCAVLRRRRWNGRRPLCGLRVLCARQSSSGNGVINQKWAVGRIPSGDDGRPILDFFASLPPLRHCGRRAWGSRPRSRHRPSAPPIYRSGRWGRWSRVSFRAESAEQAEISGRGPARFGDAVDGIGAHVIASASPDTSRPECASDGPPRRAITAYAPAWSTVHVAAPPSTDHRICGSAGA
jgi:hypothetical protein